MATIIKNQEPCHDQWFVFGVDSFSGEFCGHYTPYTTYISTVKHRDWILQVSLSIKSLNWTEVLFPYNIIIDQ